ncbi:MAG: hypothetical protein HZA04_07440 [Nitrospinae bacterium]|nr:hypothetical protein [Nitrospinota bacterium]
MQETLTPYVNASANQIATLIRLLNNRLDPINPNSFNTANPVTNIHGPVIINPQAHVLSITQHLNVLTKTDHQLAIEIDNLKELVEKELAGGDKSKLNEAYELISTVTEESCKPKNERRLSTIKSCLASISKFGEHLQNANAIVETVQKIGHFLFPTA